MAHVPSGMWWRGSVAVLGAIVMALGAVPARAGRGKFAGGSFEFCVSAAGTLTAQKRAAVQAEIQRASDLLLDATDSQHALTHVYIVDGSRARAASEYWIDTGTGGAEAHVAGYGRSGLHALFFLDTHFAGLAWNPYTIAHEHGHLAYGLYDEYLKADGTGGGMCVADPGGGQPLTACLMDNFKDRGGGIDAPTMNEFCVRSNHTTDNEQHAQHGKSCWETIATGRFPARAPGGRPVDQPEESETVNFPDSLPERRFVVIIDRSGSMQAEGKLDALKRGVKAFVSSLGTGDVLGIYDFAGRGTTRTTVGLHRIGDGGAPTRAAVLAAIDALRAEGTTAIGEALDRGATDLNTRDGVACNTVFLLLTDGMQNEGIDPATVVPTIQRLLGTVVSVAIGPDVDVSRLERLADATGGRVVRARRAQDVARELTALTAELTEGGATAREPGVVGIGDTQAVTVPIDQTTGTATFTLAWEHAMDDLRLSLVDPSGHLITAADAIVPEIRHRTDTALDVFEIDDPEPGDWTMQVTAVQTTASTARFVGVAASDSRQIAFAVAPAQLRVTYPDAITIEAVPTFGRTVANVLVGGSLIRPDGSTLSIGLADDGDAAKGDTTAGDGIYTGRFQDFLGNGAYAFDLTVVNEVGTAAPGDGIDADVPEPTIVVPRFRRVTSAAVEVTGVPGSPRVCRFDTTGDGIPDMVLNDTNGDGRCEFPQRKTHLKGTLVFDAANPVEFSGTTVVEADHIVVEEGGSLTGEPERLRSLMLYAVAGDLRSRGTIDVAAGDDLSLVARGGSVDLRGPTVLVAKDRLVLTAGPGGVTLAPPMPDPFERFTAVAGNRLEISARLVDGAIVLAGVRIGAPRLTLSTQASLSVVGAKRLEVRDSLLTTDPSRLAFAATSVGDVTLNATGPIVIDRTTIDSGHNARLQTSRAQDGACLGAGTTVEARYPTGAPGRIYVSGVRGGTHVDPGVVLVGQVVGTPIVGPCP